jgi:hypothetical protein
MNLDILKENYIIPKKYERIIKTFTENSFPINNYLWKKYNKEIEVSFEFEAIVNNIDQILFSYSMPKDMKVYHKSIYDPRKLYKIDNNIFFPCYISTSISKNYVEFYYKNRNVYKIDNIYHNNIFIINIRKGNPGIFIPDEYNIDNKVKEFIIPHSSYLKYIQTNSQETHKNNFTHFHEMELQ